MTKRIIEKKVWPEFFERILDGTKTFEARIADFECREGDVLLLREYDPQKGEYTGRCVTRRITYVLRTRDVSFWPAEEVIRHGLQIMSLSED